MIGFVLSGGANLGSIHVGMLRALLEADIKPDLIVGTSIGAVNAAYLAADPSLDQVERLQEMWCGVRARDVFPLNPLASVRALCRQGALFPSTSWRRFLTDRIPYERMEEAAVPLRITATDFEDGRSVVLDSGSVVDAVLASTALPGIFPPHQIGDRCYLDGAISDQLPLKVAIDAGVHTIYVMAVSVPSPPPDRRSPAGSCGIPSPSCSSPASGSTPWACPGSTPSSVSCRCRRSRPRCRCGTCPATRS